MSEKNYKMSQPVRITMAMVLWGLILWLFTLGDSGLLPLIRAIFIIFIIPTGLVEWLKYKGIVKNEAAAVVKVIAMIGAGAVWYFRLH